MAPEDIRRTIYRFDPHSMADAAVRALATGREAPLALTLRSIDARLTGSGPSRHLMIMGPRGIGKSFFLRLVQVALKDRGTPAGFLLLPEEQPNLTTAASLPRELHRLLTGAPAASLMPHLGAEPGDAWEAAVTELRDAIDARAGSEPGAATPRLLIAAVENFDRLLERAFKAKADQSRLRQWLDGEPRIMLIVSTLSGDLDQRYGDRLFHSFEHLRLEPWDSPEYIAYFRRRAGHERRPEGDWPEAKIRAISRFTGGSPRMAVILSDLLRADGDPVSAAETLDALVDNLTPYYQDLLWERMPDTPRALLDALIRGGEPCSQSQLAERVGLAQNRIAQPFSWLRDNEIVYGEREHQGRATLYRVADRVLVQYYRKRHLDQRALETPLAAMTEFLATFYRGDELRTHALRLFERGRTAEAAVFARLGLEQTGLRVAECPAFADPSLLQQLTAAWSQSHADRDDPADLERQLAAFEARLAEAAPDDHELRGTLWERIGLLSMKLDRAEPALAAHREALAAFGRAGNQHRAAWNWMALGWYAAQPDRRFGAFRRDARAAEDAYGRAATLAAEAGSQALASEAHCWLGWLHVCEGQWDQARQAFGTGLALAEEAELDRWQAGNLEGLARLAERDEQPNRALSLRQQALDAARRSGHPDAIAVTLGNLGLSLRALHRPEEALAAHREAVQSAEAAERQDLVDWDLVRVGELAAELGDEEAAAQAWQRLFGRLAPSRDRRQGTASQLHRAAAMLRAFKDQESAATVAEQGLRAAVAAGWSDWALAPLLSVLLPALEAGAQDLEARLDRLAAIWNPDHTEATDWQAIANALRYVNIPELAALAHRRAISEIRSDEDLDLPAKAEREASHWGQIYGMFRDAGRYRDALSTLLDVLAFARENWQHEPADLAMCRGLIAAMQLLLDADADAWKTLDDAITENPAHADEVLEAAATAIPTAERNADKATAFAIGLRLIDHLIAPPTAQRYGQAAPTESPEALPPPRPGHPTPGDAIHALFVGLLKNRPSDDLLRDLAHEVKALSAALAPTADAVLLTLDYLAQDRSPAVLERAEPDIAIAVRALVEALDAEAGEPGP